MYSHGINTWKKKILKSYMVFNRLLGNIFCPLTTVCISGIHAEQGSVLHNGFQITSPKRLGQWSSDDLHHWSLTTMKLYQLTETSVHLYNKLMGNSEFHFSARVCNKQPVLHWRLPWNLWSAQKRQGNFRAFHHVPYLHTPHWKSLL